MREITNCNTTAGLTNYEKPIDRILRRIKEVTGSEPVKTGKEYMFLCPAHPDTKASCSAREADNGGVSLHCYAGCEPEKIQEKLGITLADLGRSEKPKLGELVKAYDYVDEHGTLIFQVCRYEPKNFRQRKPDPENPGKWIWSAKAVRKVLYRLPEVLRAKSAGNVIVLTEGEKDADALAGVGLCATCNAGGAKKWDPEYTRMLQSADVWVIADKDEAGRLHGTMVASALSGFAKSVCVLELPDKNGNAVKDAADFIAAGGTADEIRTLFATCEPWTPLKAEEQPESLSLKAELLKIQMERGLSEVERCKKMAEATLAVLKQRGRFYHHADHCDFETAMYFDAHRKILVELGRDQFNAWLSELSGLNRTLREYKYVFAAIQNAALVGGTTSGIRPEMYWASRDGAIYLSNGDGSIAKITAGSVELVDNGTDDVVFAAGLTLKPWTLTTPENPFETCSLFSNVCSTAPHARDLLLLWSCSLPTGQRTKPPLVCTGPVGSGKTRLAKGLCELFGLPERLLKLGDSETGERDFWVSLDQGGLVCFDNADTTIKWLPDALASASTDGSFEKKKNYTDRETVRLNAKAWCVITSANAEFASDAGLADRLLVVRLERRNGETAESELSQEIASHRDAGLSWIAATLSRVLADEKPVQRGLNQRHPDFAEMAVRIGRAVGREAEAVEALAGAEADKSIFNVENDEIGEVLLDLLRRDGSFRGTADQLREKLKVLDDGVDKHWSAKKLGKRLDKLWPHLVKVFGARKERNRDKVHEYSFALKSSAGFAGFQVAFTNTSHRRVLEKVIGNDLPNPANPAPNPCQLVSSQCQTPLPVVPDVMGAFTANSPIITDADDDDSNPWPYVLNTELEDADDNVDDEDAEPFLPAPRESEPERRSPEPVLAAGNDLDWGGAR